MESSALFSGPWKRAKADGNIGQVASCLVDGCDADLGLCRDYHRRHKVCEIHSKTPKVIIGGRDQRFCQQCSRFHSLVEFDEGKRSCRKRLEGHNRRRRKPHLCSVSRNPGFISSSQHGTRFFSFGSPQVPASAAAVKPENSTVSYRNQLPSNKAVNQLQFIPDTARRSASRSSKSISDQAHSLLSSAPTVNGEFGWNETETMLPLTRSIVENWLDVNDLGPFTLTEDSKPVVSAAISHGGNVVPEMFQQGSSTNVSNQTLTFLWE